MKLPKLPATLTAESKQKIVTVAAIVGLLLIVIGGLYISDPHHKGPPKTAQQKAAADVVTNFRGPSSAVDPSQVWITTGQAKLHELEKQNADLSHQLQQVQDQMNYWMKSGRGGVPVAETKSTPPLPGDKDRLPPEPSSALVHPQDFPRNALPPPPSAGPRPALYVPTGSGTGKALPVSGRIVDVSLAAPSSTGSDKVGSDNKGTSTKKTPTVMDSIPAGAFGSAVLLTGLDAPTGGLAKTNPIPVVMKLLDNGSLPNDFTSRVKQCRVTGAGYGDLSAERAYIRLEVLSCVMHDGKIIDTTIDGYIADESGKAGMRGVVVSKQGQMIARALFAGIASGLGQSIATSYSTVQTSPLGTTSTVNPDQVFQAGAASGVGKALEKVADFYIARANELYPVVEVDSARRGDIVLKKLVDLGPTFAEAWSDEE